MLPCPIPRSPLLLVSLALSGGLFTVGCDQASGGGGSQAADAGVDSLPASDTTPNQDPMNPNDLPCDAPVKGFECPCDFNTECASGFCIAVDDETFASACSMTCEQEPCPEGWDCTPVVGGGDPTTICVPRVTYLCEPCVTNSDCGGLGDMCLPLSEGDFCARDCVDTQVPCPDGYTCQEVTDGDGFLLGRQCLPSHGSCLCGPEIDLLSDPNNCGACDNVCAWPGASASCVEGVCAIGGCDPGRVDLDGDPANGCEYLCSGTGSSDIPDAEGIDSNCDGLDGEAHRGVFVAPYGIDSSAGTRLNPVKTINRALDLADADLLRDRLFVAAGTYQEQLTLTGGTSIFGGYSADGEWSRDLAAYETTVTWGTPGEYGEIRTVLIESPEEVLRLGGLTFRSGNNPNPSGTSYGVWMSNAGPMVTLVNSRVIAGNGGGGLQGAAGEPGSAGAVGQPGISTTATDCDCNKFETYGGKGGPGGAPTCGTGLSTGGHGADSTCGDDDDANPGGPSIGGSVGGAPESSGWNGLNGAAGSVGPGGDAYGWLTEGGLWMPADGYSGGAGGDGAGGGGGGSGKGHGNGWWACASWGGGGGGGGSGGCGGAGGVRGTGGGGSFAVFLFHSSPSLKSCVFSHKSGGNGGQGGGAGSGGQGKPGGAGGAGHEGATDGGGGGQGGHGGTGGGGGGGAGGAAFAIYATPDSVPVCQGSKLEALGVGGIGGFGADPFAEYKGGVGPSGWSNLDLVGCIEGGG